MPTSTLQAFVIQTSARDQRQRVDSGALTSFLSAHGISPPCSTILDERLYLASRRSAQGQKTLDRLKITHVLSILDDSRELTIPGNRVHHRISLDDLESENLLAILPEAVAWVNAAMGDDNARIMVHCEHGVSRSASVVIAWLMKDREWGLEDSLAFVKEKRSAVNPNAGFLKQLKEWESVDG